MLHQCCDSMQNAWAQLSPSLSGSKTLNPVTQLHTYNFMRWVKLKPLFFFEWSGKSTLKRAENESKKHSWYLEVNLEALRCHTSLRSVPELACAFTYVLWDLDEGEGVLSSLSRQDPGAEGRGHGSQTGGGHNFSLKEGIKAETERITHWHLVVAQARKQISTDVKPLCSRFQNADFWSWTLK